LGTPSQRLLFVALGELDALALHPRTATLSNPNVRRGYGCDSGDVCDELWDDASLLVH
jgi:hypothetical protein